MKTCRRKRAQFIYSLIFLFNVTVPLTKLSVVICSSLLDLWMKEEGKQLISQGLSRAYEMHLSFWLLK